MLISIIIPTYKEAPNLTPLCTSIAEEFNSIKYEILIMDDDSQDGSDKVVAELQKQEIPVSIINRKGHKRGLSAAVIDGLRIAKGDYCAVMDADLSHPVSSIKPMLDKLQQGEVDFCLGSRYVDGASIDIQWTLKRRVISMVATLLAVPLSKIKDPMSGFFLLASKNVPPINKLSPLGYKIALELIVKGGFDKIYEHPIHFSERLHGNSKMNVRQQFYYLRHLRRLYQYKYPTMSEFLQFGMVGGSGFVVDVTFYYMFQSLFGMSHLAARAASFWLGASWNWYWNRTVTFSEYFKAHPVKQWLSFVFVSIFGFVINWGLYSLLTINVAFFDEYRILALLLGVLGGMGFNFMFSRIFIFRHIEEDEGEK